ncbi:Sec7 domain-containing protein [Babesia caballi]|uniref:Sec7 domain-containing protein n=1 Tax=Babesia caballi TaxID=5871 RepID=A0AAV4LMX1_BABCB|nr:Sec7 domain-containing protein [Babesia caballi]
MENTERPRTHAEVPRHIEVVKLEAYHVLSALKDHLRNSASSTSYVPGLGTDTSVTKSLQDPTLSRYFKFLIVKGVPSEDIFLDMGHIRPFLEVMKICDSKQNKLIILCAEAISKFTHCENAKFAHKNAAVVLNTTFEELLALFSTNIEPKEDLQTLKILKTLCDILRSNGGNLITNENICVMFKMIATLLTARHRHTTIRKLIHDEVVKLLQASLGQYDKNAIKPAKPKSLSRRINSTFIFISLLLAQTSAQHPFSFHAEDSFLSPEDKETVAMFRNDFAVLSQNVIAVPASWNEFCSDVCVVGLETLNRTMELGALTYRQYGTVLPIVQVFVANSVYRMCFTESLSLYSLVLRSLKNMLFCFRTQMKAQVEALLTHIVASVVNHIYGTKTYAFKADIIEMNMEFIVDICHNTQLILEIYANYDCDVRCANLSDVVVKAVIACLVPTHEFEGNSTITEQMRQKVLQSKAAMKRKSGSAYAKSPSDNITVINFEYMALNAVQGILKALANNTLETEPPPNSVDASHFARQKRWKETLRRAADIFNAADLGDDWIPLVKKIGLLPEKHEARDVAAFLKNVPDLDFKKVGEYLGTHKNPEFMDRVRSEFAKLHSFRGLPVVMAIRLFLSSFRLPGESQQIERIIEVFAATYFEAQPVVDESEDRPDGATKMERRDGGAQSKAPRWIVQENVFWQLNFTSYGVANVGTINDHIAAEEEAPYQHFTRQFMHNEIENILANERINLVSEAIRDESVLEGMVLTHSDSSQAEEDLKSGRGKDSGVGEGALKPGFACVANADVIFVLSYSIIMLNTDLHNSQVKKKMKLEDFVKNNKGINNGKNLPFEFLEDIYTTIKHHEIKLHKAPDHSEVVKYDGFFWVDHVLQRQRLMGSFNTDLWEHGWGIKRSVLQVLCRNNLHKALNAAVLGAQTAVGLKRCLRVLWLYMRVALKFQHREAVNQIFQLGSVNIDDCLGYRCQLSLAFILTVIASASNLFDRESWVKVMDTVTKLYYLNLLPLSFAALDIDAQVYGNCSALTDALVPPTIRFKRNADAKRGAGWLGGWTNFITFSKPASTSTSEQGDDLDCDIDELAKLNFETPEAQPSQQQFLFLFDVQSGCDVAVANPYFNVDLIKRGVSPIASKEDEDAVKEVTQAFTNDTDKEELLPQVLAYMNLRLAFLNIYNVNHLFLGATTNIDSLNYLAFMKVVVARIVEAATKEKQAADTAKVSPAASQQQGPGAQTSAKLDPYLAQEGSLLEPCAKEIRHFNDKVQPSFCLGIFTKVCTAVLEQTKVALKGKGDRLGRNEESKLKITVVFIVKCFYLMASAWIFPEALDHIPKPDDVLGALGLVREGDEMHEQIYKDEGMAALFVMTEKLEKAVKYDTALSSYICILMLKLILWMTENAAGDAIALRRSSRRRVKTDSKKGEHVINGKKGASEGGDGGIRWSELCLWLSGWLLHMLVHFENRVFYNHIEPTVKVLASVATNKVIAQDEYIVKVMMAALQRVTNHNLPFSKDESTTRPGPARNRRILKTIGTVLPVFLGNYNNLRKKNVHVMTQYLIQTLLSITVFAGSTEQSQEGEHNQGVVAIQALVKLRGSDAGIEGDDVLWLYALHALALISSMGPQRIYVEAMKALTKMLLKEAPPKGRCSKVTQVVRIFDYLLTPILTNNFQYPLPYNAVAMPITAMPPKLARSRETNWKIVGPFSDARGDPEQRAIWMETSVIEHIAGHYNEDADDVNTRKAEMTSLICQYMLVNLPTLSTMGLEEADLTVVKEASSNLEYLLYSSDRETCSPACFRRLITITNHILNVIIPSNGVDCTDPTSDTYLESLKNFLLVLLTAPELKSAERSCLQHVKNDTELKQCLELVKGAVDMSSSSPGEYVLAALLAHTFSTSDFLKELFLDILRVVFPGPPPGESSSEHAPAESTEN